MEIRVETEPTGCFRCGKDDPHLFVVPLTRGTVLMCPKCIESMALWFAKALSVIAQLTPSELPEVCKTIRNLHRRYGIVPT